MKPRSPPAKKYGHSPPAGPPPRRHRYQRRHHQAHIESEADERFVQPVLERAKDVYGDQGRRPNPGAPVADDPYATPRIGEWEDRSRYAVVSRIPSAAGMRRDVFV